MKFKEKAREDMVWAVEKVENEPRYPRQHLPSCRADYYAECLRVRGWGSVSPKNVYLTAISLGFFVVGDQIFNPDD